MTESAEMVFTNDKSVEMVFTYKSDHPEVTRCSSHDAKIQSLVLTFLLRKVKVTINTLLCEQMKVTRNIWPDV